MATPTDEIHSLRSEMNARLTQVEKWLERVTVAMEKLTDNRERLLVLEVRFKSELERQDREIEALREDMAEVTKTLKCLNAESHGQNLSIARLSTFKAGVIAVVTMIGSGLISLAVKLWGN